MSCLQMKKTDYPGVLITFCGLDGSGKTTMIRRLTERLCQEGYAPFLTKQPTKAVRQSEIFRTYMDQEDHSRFAYRSLSLLAASDRVQHTEMIIEPRLAAGDLVISDRYFYSCLANLRARGYKQDQWIYEIGATIVEPDLCVFLDVPVDVAVARVRMREEEKDRYIDINLQHELREQYLEIGRQCQGLILSTEMNEVENFLLLWKEVKKILTYKQKEKVNRIIQNFTVWEDEIEDNLGLENDLGFDSLKRTELVVALEEEFQIEFDIEDLSPENFSKVGDIHRIIEKHIA